MIALPRLPFSTALRAQLQKVVESFNTLFDNGPIFSHFIDSNPRIVEIKKYLLTIIKDSYNQGYQSVQSYLDYYHIFKIGSTWDANSYIRSRGRKDQTIDLSFTINETKENFIFDTAFS
jgi:hypothetical protein